MLLWVCKPAVCKPVIAVCKPAVLMKWHSVVLLFVCSFFLPLFLVRCHPFRQKKGSSHKQQVLSFVQSLCWKSYRSKPRVLLQNNGCCHWLCRRIFSMSACVDLWFGGLTVWVCTIFARDFFSHQEIIPGRVTTFHMKITDIHPWRPGNWIFIDLRATESRFFAIWDLIFFPSCQL